MYVVRSRKGKPVARFNTKCEAEVFVRIRSAARSPVTSVASLLPFTVTVEPRNGYWIVRATAPRGTTLPSGRHEEIIKFQDEASARAFAANPLNEQRDANREALLRRTQRARTTYQRRATGAPETFRAVAVDHRGSVLGTWTGPTVQGLMATVDHTIPLEKAWSVTIRGEYTSDGAWHSDHGGRMVASRERGPNRGRGGWITY